MTDVEVDAQPRASDGAEPGSGPAPLSWPPPGLARLQGDAFGAARWLTAGALLILPLMWAVVAEQDPWSLGPLGEMLWLALVLGGLGVPILMAGYVALSRLFGRTSQALEQGHRWKVVALVAADQRRDTGFLLQGARAYGALTRRMRRSLARNRLVVAGLLLFGALWLSLGFGLAVVLAARGVLTPMGVAALTLLPAGTAAALGMAAYGWEELVLRRMRKRWYQRPWTEDMAREEVRSWNTALGEHAPGVLGSRRGRAPAADDEGPADEGGRGTVRLAFRTANVLLLALMFVAFVPVFALVFSAAILPVLTRVAVPELEAARSRYAALEPLRRYALTPDPGISAAEAGAALHTLSFVGRPYRASEGVLPPEREYPTPWFPVVGSGSGVAAPTSPDGAAPDPTGAPAPSAGAAISRGAEPDWARAAVTRMGGDLDDRTAARLEAVAAHPAREELARLGRAAALDVAGARWSMPLPSEVTLAELAIPPMAPVRSAAYAGLAVAALDADAGRMEAAETGIREVLSAGLLLADQGPTLFDNMIGIVMAELAAEALQSFYRNTGRAEAEALAWSRGSAARSVERAQAGMPQDAESRLRGLSAGVVDPDLIRGARWESVSLLNTLGPCMNLRRVVFGPEPGSQGWVKEARAELVRSPAEAELFEVARSGLLGGKMNRPPSLPTRLLALTMGGSGEPGSCARVFGELVSF